MWPAGSPAPSLRRTLLAMLLLVSPLARAAGAPVPAGAASGAAVAATPAPAGIPAAAAARANEPYASLRREIALAEDRRDWTGGVLARALAHGDAGVRARAVLATGRLQDSTSVEPLLPLLADHVPAVRREAAFPHSNNTCGVVVRIRPAASNRWNAFFAGRCH